MSLSNVKPVYPNSVFQWIDRIDNQDIDFANDINSVVSEIESIETTVGTTPLTETGAPTGTPINYPTLSSRISDAMSNAQLPFVSLNLSAFNIPNVKQGFQLPFKASIDGYKSYNGTDITIPATGWWSVSSVIQWSWWNQGYSYHYVTLNGGANIISEDFIDWAFSGNTQPVLYTPGPIVNGIPTVFTHPSITIPVWWGLGKRPRRTSITWQGALHKGDRISAYAENGTSNASMQINNVTLKASMLRVVPGTFTSG